MESSLLPSPVETVKPGNPWGLSKVNVPVVPSLLSVMDEELAREIDRNEGVEAWNKTPVEAQVEVSLEVSSGSDTANDLMLAQMLQLQFDEEYEKDLKAKENRMNGTSKVSISFDNYRTIHPGILEGDLTSSDDDIDYDDQVKNDKAKQSGGKSGGGSRRKRYQSNGSGKNITTKHDADVCGRKNAQNIEKFPPSFAAGDVGSKELDLKISNNVYNTLKQHSIKEEKQSYRLHEKKEHSTHEQALDPKTRLLLYKLVNSEILEEVNGCISTGKEACVFHAFGGKMEDKVVPRECAVKVFKTTLNEFKTRDRYIKDDHRFKDRLGKQNPRKTIKLWAEKEMCNLSRMMHAGIRCPEVVLLKKQVLVMSFIGNGQHPAPKLKDVALTTPQATQAYKQCIEMMAEMYQKCNLIHADLSEYNMLWYQNEVYFIDVSQSVEPVHPHALEFLYRDCKNVTSFFEKFGVEIISAENLFNQVSKLDIPVEQDEDFMSKVVKCERFLSETKINKKLPEKEYAFDYLFHKNEATE
ncbi:serine/threonine-protein kinase RIO3-like [Dendronephthya gigantea]|uniref:serine/threonine-protein kinase RIO3-like n=1 Tax=Dendronephthya gigantea TaxID=151771 RepID=UPI001069CC77|nr:serine/threonine-protein kinase RIO3-like [Dendronephthya gigantea]